MAMRESLQLRLWLLAFCIVQLVGLWRCYGAWLARKVSGHAG
jgi:hypothetical protein